MRYIFLCLELFMRNLLGIDCMIWKLGAALEHLHKGERKNKMYIYKKNWRFKIYKKSSTGMRCRLWNGIIWTKLQKFQIKWENTWVVKCGKGSGKNKNSKNQFSRIWKISVIFENLWKICAKKKYFFNNFFCCS